jgi:hypothetical protein
MKNRFATLAFACLAATASLGAGAQFKSMQSPYAGVEASPATLQLPSQGNAVLAVSSCETCEKQLLRVTPKTVYRLNDQAVALKEFSLALGKQPNAAVLVVYATATSEVTRVVARF